MGQGWVVSSPGERLLSLVDAARELVGGTAGGREPVAGDGADRGRVARVRAIHDHDVADLDQVVDELLELSEQLRQPTRQQAELGQQLIDVDDVQDRSGTGLVVECPDRFGGASGLTGWSPIRGARGSLDQSQCR